MVSRQRVSQLKYPEKVKASRAVAAAVQSGRLTRPEHCSICGIKGRIEAHHEDYSKPLEVEWVCRPCHGKIHRSEANCSVCDKPIRYNDGGRIREKLCKAHFARLKRWGSPTASYRDKVVMCPHTPGKLASVCYKCRKLADPLMNKKVNYYHRNRDAAIRSTALVRVFCCLLLTNGWSPNIENLKLWIGKEVGSTTSRTPSAFRLTAETKELLRALASADEVNLTSELTRLIRDEAKRRNVRLDQTKNEEAQ